MSVSASGSAAGPRYPSADTLMNEAMAETGLSDFGAGDFREGLAVLLESLERDAGLHPSTDAKVIGDQRRRLRNRLELEQWYKEHPELEQLPLRGPVDINGLPRTGTTALSNMLSIDPQFRTLRGWEQAQPCPPPVLADEEQDPRRLQALRDMEKVPAEVKAMHLFDVDAAMEDTEVLGMCFHGQEYTMPVYGYHAWWRRTDPGDTYRYHRRVVTLLQSRRPPDLWLFKSPHHNFHLEAIAAAYPDARFIMTHRDPTKAVPSWASIVSNVIPAADGERDLERLGREAAAHLRVGVERAIAERARLPAERFFDVYHRELNADPMGVLERIYDFLELELRPQVRKDLEEWQQTNRRGAHGAHAYTAEQFGLTRDQLRSDFDLYIRHFDVPLDA